MKMNMKSAEKAYKYQERTGKTLSCMVSTNEVSGKGRIINCHYVDLPQRHIGFEVKMRETGEVVMVPMTGVMRING